MEILLVSLRFVQYMAVMILFGSSLFPYYALARNGNSRGCNTDIAAFVQRVAFYASLAALLSAVGWLGCEAVLMSGDANGYREGATIWTVLSDTEFGGIWRWRLLLLLLLPIFLGWRLLRHRKPLVWPILASGILLVASLAGVGHGAMGIGFSVWAHLGNQAVHLLAAGVWVGGLLSLFHTIRYTRDAALGVEIQRHALERFSLVGFVAVMLIFVSGLLNSWFLVGSFDALLHTTYGQVLMVKVTFFLFMVALAVFNRLFLMPRLASASDSEVPLRLLLRSVAAEQIFAILVVASVSLLGTLPPAMDRMVM
ncbi:MAG TPA: copper homeostasis membrane protein CopD [Rhizomicrobium sp.]|jgi:putative copper resistance protein D|nr:copper homeostasis membrane protein CopD [Rhizomicrobium sp.]